MQRIAFISLFDEICMNLRYTSSMLRHDGHQTFINLLKGSQHPAQPRQTTGPNNHCAASPEEISLLTRTLKSQIPDLIVLFFSHEWYGLARVLTKQIKNEFTVPVVWAGDDTTNCPSENIQYADIICPGEAEYPLRFLAEAMDKGQEYSKIPSLWIKQNGEIHKNPAIHLETNLDILPFPDFDPSHSFVIEEGRLENAIAPAVSSLRSNIPIQTARSCPFTCPYCGTAHDGIEHGEQSSLRIRSADSILEEIKHRLRTWPWPVERIEFPGTPLPLDPNWLDEFIERYPAEIALPFLSVAAINQHDEETCRRLRKAGMFAAILPIPSGSGPVLRDIFQQNTNQDSFIQTARVLSNAGISLLCQLTVNNPFESEEHKRQTLHLLQQLPGEFSVLDGTPFTLYGNCPLFEKIKQQEPFKGMHQAEKEHAWTAKPNPEHLFWDCMYKLAQFNDICPDALSGFVNDEYMRHHPVALAEVVSNLYKTTYALGDPMRNKDQFVFYLRNRLSDAQSIASQPVIRQLRKLVSPAA